MKVSFDFDYTLSRKAVQKFAKELMQKGYEVHIVTRRFEDSMRYADPRFQTLRHRDMFRICFYLNIPREHIHFTNMDDKYPFFLNNPNFLFHLDDDIEEIEMINTHTSVKGVLCNLKLNWKDELNKYLENTKY